MSLNWCIFLNIPVLNARGVAKKVIDTDKKARKVTNREDISAQCAAEVVTQLSVPPSNTGVVNPTEQ